MGNVSARRPAGRNSSRDNAWSARRRLDVPRYKIEVTMTPNGSAPPIHFGENEIAVALIVFCNKKGIPIARRALKSLQVVQDSVSLHLAIRS